MPSDGSVTRMIGQVQLGDPAAVRQLWQRYFQRLVGLARKKLADAPRRVFDEEDVASSALASFFRNAEQGRFPDLADRDELWRLLVIMTARKAVHLCRDNGRQKRGGGRLVDAGTDESCCGIVQEILSSEPDPAVAAAAADEHRRLMEALHDDQLRLVAQRRLEGYSVEEIAKELKNIAPRSIKRKLQLIRDIWKKELAS